MVAGLDWRLEGEHIHPADIAPVLALVPPPQWLLQLLGRRRLQPWWPALARGMAWITSHASPTPGGNFASGDRSDLHLPPDQIALIEAVAAANPRTVVALKPLLRNNWADALTNASRRLASSLSAW